jgi:hypothetical protein
LPKAKISHFRKGSISALCFGIGFCLFSGPWSLAQLAQSGPEAQSLPSLDEPEPQITDLSEVSKGPYALDPSVTILSIENGVPQTPASALKYPIPLIHGPDPFGRQAIPLTLDESIQIGIKHSTDTLKARNEDQASGVQLLQAYGQFLPMLDVSTSYGYQTGKIFSTATAPTTVFTENHGPSYQISTSFNIFNGFSDISTLRGALAKKYYTELTLKRARQQIALDIAQAYLQVTLDHQIIRIANKNLAASQARQKLLEEQTE